MSELPINYKLKNKDGSLSGVLLNVLIVVACLIIIFQLFFCTAYAKIYVIGASMEDTLNGAESLSKAGGDYVYVIKGAKPERGKIAVISTDDKIIIKRIIALGGETVELKDGELYINGELKSEPYVSAENNDPRKNNFASMKVPEGCMFFMGDNRDVSVDSRNKYGCMPVECAVGIVADWSFEYLDALTAFNTFFDFTLPEAFGLK